ncbi:MAG: hypothetical protein QOD39_5183 [Mycobacterium sp.]|nr:hypothetical protein [Mycobacterium sp.]
MTRLRATIAMLVAVATAMSLASVASAADTTAEAEAMAVSPPNAGAVLSDGTASGGKAVRMWWNSSISVTGTVPASSQIVVVAKSQDCFGPASMTIRLDGTPVLTTAVKNGVWTPYTVTATIPAGVHTISIAFTNDFNLLFLCDRALYVDKVSVVAAGPTEPPPTSGTCTQTADSSAPLAFSDEFEGTAGAVPNAALWSYQLGGGGSQVYTNFPRNGSLDGNGNLAISALKEQTTVPWYGTYAYTSALIHTLGKGAMCYGSLRTRIKLPNGKGVHPAVYLLGTNAPTVGWPAAGEIDIAEAANGVSGSAAHGTGFDMASAAPFDITGDWHEFWATWERDKIVTGVDNQTIGTYTPASLPQGASWPFNDHPMFLVLELAIGGVAGEPDNTTQFPATMLVDWVRYTPPS